MDLTNNGFLFVYGIIMGFFACFDDELCKKIMAYEIIPIQLGGIIPYIPLNNHGFCHCSCHDIIPLYYNPSINW